jgi:ribosomal protein S10
MNMLGRFINKIISKLNRLSGKAATALDRVRRTSSPLADRLLADALRLAEIPSPTHQEEQRAAFILERLANLGISPQMDEHGNILVRILSAEPGDNPALLLFSDMGSNHWHPLDSLTRLDPHYARGTGLADVLGCATLLSVAESVKENRLQSGRDLILLFAARSLDDPGGNAFFSISDEPAHFPCAAIGIRGLTLGSVVTNTQGIYRIRVTMGREQKEKEPEKDEAEGPDTPLEPETANRVVDTLIATARKLSGITWDSKGTTHFFIRRIEAGTGFGRAPQEGVLEIELESSDGAQLEMAMNTVKATAENTAKFAVESPKPDPAIKTEVNIASYIPVGEQSKNQELLKTIRELMKELHIRLREENGADPSAILSNRGIPAFSIGIARGWEGLNSDTIEIASIEKGRQLIEALVSRIGQTGAQHG